MQLRPEQVQNAHPAVNLLHQQPEGLLISGIVQT